MRKEPITIFFSYAHEDELLRDELVKHLKGLERQGVIQSWHDRNITAGEEWENAIDTHLASADIILLLISADFVASDYCYDIELKRALERHECNEARVIPVILRSVDWHRSPFGKLAALPTDGKAISSWANQDEAFTDVVQGLRRVISQLKGMLFDSSTTSEDNSVSPRPTEDPLIMSQNNTGNSTGYQINVSGGTVNINATSPRASIDSNGHHPEALTVSKHGSGLDRLALIQMLNALPAAQFNELVFALNPPNGNIPGNDASQGKRSSGLLEWVESPVGPGLILLQSILNQIVKHAGGHTE